MSQTTGVRYDSQSQQAQVEVPLHPRKKAKHWQEIFKKYDLDNDGRISLTELRAMILSESYENDIPDYTVRMIMQKADEDQSGYLDMREFEKMYWMHIFEKYDLDRDGRISIKELTSFLRAQGDDEIPREIVVRLLNLGDKNQDNYLTFDEFHKLVHSKEFRNLMGHMVNAYIRSTIVPRKHIDEFDSRGDYEDQYSCRPPSVCMILISIIEIITYLWDVISEGNHVATGPAAQVFIYDPRKRYEVWRFLTYMFVHVGVMHITVNLLVQVLLGTPLEMVHRWWRVLIIYFAGVLAGSLGTSISDPKVYLAGASGGVYALITAHVSSIIMNWSEMRFALLQLAVFFILTASDIGTAIYNRYVVNVEDRIGYAAHLAGALAGLLVGINVLRNLQVKRWEKVLWWISLITYCALMLAGIIWNVAFPDYFPREIYSKEFRHLMGHMINAYVHSVVVPRKSEYEDVDGIRMYEEEYSCRPPTFFMVIISLMEVITYLCDQYPIEGNEPGGAARIFTYDPEKKKEIWRFVTYMFVHDGSVHIIGNLLVQILLGIPLEMVHKWWRVLLIYFAGVLAGSLGTSIIHPQTKLVGASGGVYALITAHIASIVMNWSEMRFAPLQLVVMFIWVGCDISGAIYRRSDKIGYVAHLAGALAGLLVGINVLRNLQVRKWEKVIWWIAIITYCILMLGAIIWNIIN